MNWVSLIIILVCAGLIDYFIGAAKDKKVMKNFENEFLALDEIKTRVFDIYEKVVK